MAIPNLSSFDAWWESDGKFYDPDWSDVPWYDKRKSLAEYAWHRAVAAAPLPARAKLLNIAAKVARREYLPSLEKCRTINDARLEVGRYDERHATLAMDLKAVFDEFRAAAPSREWINRWVESNLRRFVVVEGKTSTEIIAEIIESLEIARHAAQQGGK